MGIMKTLHGLSKADKEKQIEEYHEARNRLKEAQKPKKSKKIRKKPERKNGKVITYHLD